MRIILIAAVIVITFLLSGCSNKIPVQNRPIIEQTNLLQKCTSDTPLPTNYVLNEEGKKVYNGTELYTTLRDWQDVYSECASKHNKLVDTLIGLQEMKEIKK